MKVDTGNLEGATSTICGVFDAMSEDYEAVMPSMVLDELEFTDGMRPFWLGFVTALLVGHGHEELTRH